VETCKNGGMLASDLASKLRMMAFVLVLLVAIGLLLPFGWLLFRTENFDTPAPAPIFILSELPLLVSLIVLATAHDDKRASIGAGVAFGAASILSLLVPVFYLGTIGANWMRQPTYPHLADFRSALAPAFLVSVCVMIFAILNRKESRGFVAGFAAGISYYTLAFILGLVISIPGSGAEKARDADERVPPSVAAAPILRSLTACLIRHQADHPQEGFPDSLEKIDASWGCDVGSFKPTRLNHYWTSYRPVKDSQSGRNTDFRIQAISVNTLYYSVLVSDERGMVLEYQQWGVQHPPVAYRVAFAPHVYGSDIEMVALSVKNFTNTFGHGVPPPSIQDALSVETKLNAILRSGMTPDPHDPNILYASNDAGRIYAVQYLPPTAENPAHFAISATCAMYGANCLRSDYLDVFGDIHGTGEPRPATAQDPVIPFCERSSDACDDPVWPLSAQPSQWQQIRANALYLFYTTKWW